MKQKIKHKLIDYGILTLVFLIFLIIVTTVGNELTDSGYVDCIHCNPNVLGSFYPWSLVAIITITGILIFMIAIVHSLAWFPERYRQ